LSSMHAADRLIHVNREISRIAGLGIDVHGYYRQVPATKRSPGQGLAGLSLGRVTPMRWDVAQW
jgi:hypothetical protein